MAIEPQLCKKVIFFYKLLDSKWKNMAKLYNVKLKDINYKIRSHFELEHYFFIGHSTIKNHEQIGAVITKKLSRCKRDQSTKSFIKQMLECIKRHKINISLKYPVYSQQSTSFCISDLLGS